MNNSLFTRLDALVLHLGAVKSAAQAFEPAAIDTDDFSQGVRVTGTGFNFRSMPLALHRAWRCGNLQPGCAAEIGLNGPVDWKLHADSALGLAGKRANENLTKLLQKIFL